MTLTFDKAVAIPVWDPPRSLRAVRHALANALLPMVIGVDMLSGEDPDSVSLLAASVTTLQRQVALLDLVTSQGHFPLVPVDLPQDPRGGSPVALEAPAPVAQILQELPGPWGITALDTGAVVASAPHAAYADLASISAPGEPFAVPELGLGMTALARVLDSIDVPLYVSPDGIAHFILPVDTRQGPA